MKIRVPVIASMSTSGLAIQHQNLVDKLIGVFRRWHTLQYFERPARFTKSQLGKRSSLR